MALRLRFYEPYENRSSCIGVVGLAPDEVVGTDVLFSIEVPPSIIERNLSSLTICIPSFSAF